MEDEHVGFDANDFFLGIIIAVTIGAVLGFLTSDPSTWLPLGLLFGILGGAALSHWRNT